MKQDAAHEVIRTAQEIPPYLSNVGRPGGPVALREDDAKILALLEVSEKNLVVLWAGESERSHVLVTAKARATISATRFQRSVAQPLTLLLCAVQTKMLLPRRKSSISKTPR